MFEDGKYSNNLRSWNESEKGIKNKRLKKIGKQREKKERKEEK